MPIYTEKDDKLNVKLTGTENDITIRLDCYYGTKASLAFGDNQLLNCGDTLKIRSDAGASGRITFSGSCSNPQGGTIKVTHTVLRGEEVLFTYTFPNDYTGTPPYSATDKTPSYEFRINFTQS